MRAGTVSQAQARNELLKKLEDRKPGPPTFKKVTRFFISLRPDFLAGYFSIWQRHFEHRVGTDFEIATSVAWAHDGARERGLVDAVLYEGYVDVDVHDFAQR
jgi:hypothetical protein